MSHLLSGEDEIFSRVFIQTRIGLPLFDSHTLGYTIGLEEERSQQSGKTRENKAIVDIIIPKWKPNEYPFHAVNLHIHSSSS